MSHTTILIPDELSCEAQSLLREVSMNSLLQFSRSIAGVLRRYVDRCTRKASRGRVTTGARPSVRLSVLVIVIRAGGLFHSTGHHLKESPVGGGFTLVFRGRRHRKKTRIVDRTFSIVASWRFETASKIELLLKRKSTAVSVAFHGSRYKLVFRFLAPKGRFTLSVLPCLLGLLATALKRRKSAFWSYNPGFLKCVVSYQCIIDLSRFLLRIASAKFELWKFMFIVDASASPRQGVHIFVCFRALPIFFWVTSPTVRLTKIWFRACVLSYCRLPRERWMRIDYFVLSTCPSVCLSVVLRLHRHSHITKGSAISHFSWWIFTGGVHMDHIASICDFTGARGFAPKLKVLCLISCQSFK